MVKRAGSGHHNMMLQVNQIADHCQVSTRTVQRWITTQKLKCHKLPSGHFRIQKDDFKKFLLEYDFPLESLLFNFNQQNALLVDLDTSRSDDLKVQFAQSYPQLKCYAVTTLWEAAALCGLLKPQVICVSLDYRLEDLTSFCRGVRSRKEIKNTLLMAVEDVSMPEVPKGVLRQFHQVMELPLSLSAFKKKLKGWVTHV